MPVIIRTLIAWVIGAAMIGGFLTGAIVFYDIDSTVYVGVTAVAAIIVAFLVALLAGWADPGDEFDNVDPIDPAGSR